MMHHFQALHWLLLFYVIGMTSTCYITNCPPGGKRSVGENRRMIRQCPACGPGSHGRCFGPELCCSDLYGCYMKTRETAICRLESFNPIPCDNDVPSCGQKKAKCAADGICCTSEQCTIDERCRSLSGDSGLGTFYQHALTDIDIPKTIGQR